MNASTKKLRANEFWKTLLRQRSFAVYNVARFSPRSSAILLWHKDQPFSKVLQHYAFTWRLTMMCKSWPPTETATVSFGPRGRSKTQWHQIDDHEPCQQHIGSSFTISEWWGRRPFHGCSSLAVSLKLLKWLLIISVGNGCCGWLRRMLVGDACWGRLRGICVEDGREEGCWGWLLTAAAGSKLH